MRRGSSHIVIAFLFSAILFGCAETGVDPDTAKVTGGDLADSIPELDLQKASVSVGFVGGAGGNAVVESFIRFERRVRYEVDTLDDGFPVGLRRIVLEAKLDSEEDEGDDDHSNPFHPMKGVRLDIPKISIGPAGTGEVAISGTDGSTGGPLRAGLRVSMIRPGESADLFVRPDTTTGDVGSVRITSVNTAERYVTMEIFARIHHDRAERLPHTVVLRMLFELPY